MRRRSRSIALPLAQIGRQHGTLLLVLLACALIATGQLKPGLFEPARLWMTDLMAPVAAGVSAPLKGGGAMLEGLREFGQLRDQNARLRADNARLRQWQSAALNLEAELGALRQQMNYRPPAARQVVTTRVLADPGGPYVHSLVLPVGRAEGVESGQAVMAGEAMVGRVTEVGRLASRLLLLTDFNSRVPVLLGDSGGRAVLAGNNSPRPTLQYLEADAPVRLGERVVTSGHGGLFPPGLPLGTVAAIEGRGADRIIHIAPLADPDRLDYVTAVEFGFGERLETLERR